MKLKDILEGCLFTDGDWIESKDQDANGDIRLIQLSDIGDGYFVNKSKKFINEETARKLRCTFLRKDDILIARMPDPLGRACLFPFEENNKYITAVDVCILRPNDKCNNRYLQYCLNSPEIRSIINRQKTGTTRERITRKKLGELEIPFPSLKVQQKIVDILDAADILRLNNKTLLIKYDTLAQSIFLHMFGDPVRNEKEWECKTIEQLVRKEKNSIKRGPFGGALKKEIFVENGYLVYEQFHALNNDFSMQRYFIDERKFNELKGFEVKSGDIIISCSGVYLGKLALVPKNSKQGIINQALLKVTIDENIMRNDFFIFHFSHKNFRQKYFDSNRGAGIPNFPPMSEFKKFPFITPSLDLQNQFAEKITLIEQQKELAKQELKESEDLFNCLLQKAFKGELT